MEENQMTCSGSQSWDPDLILRSLTSEVLRAGLNLNSSRCPHQKTWALLGSQPRRRRQARTLLQPGVSSYAEDDQEKENQPPHQNINAVHLDI